MDITLSVIIAAICLSGANCDEKDPCLQYTANCPRGMLCYGDCLPNVKCQTIDGVSTCGGCVPGWKGINCEADEDECTYMGFSPCQNCGICVNLKGTYKCNCANEWTGKDCTCKRGTACDPAADATQLSPRSFGSIVLLSVSILWARIGVSIE